MVAQKPSEKVDLQLNPLAEAARAATHKTIADKMAQIRSHLEQAADGVFSRINSDERAPVSLQLDELRLAAEEIETKLDEVIELLRPLSQEERKAIQNMAKIYEENKMNDKKIRNKECSIFKKLLIEFLDSISTEEEPHGLMSLGRSLGFPPNISSHKFSAKPRHKLNNKEMEELGRRLIMLGMPLDHPLFNREKAPTPSKARKSSKPRQISTSPNQNSFQNFLAGYKSDVETWKQQLLDTLKEKGIETSAPAKHINLPESSFSTKAEGDNLTDQQLERLYTWLLREGIPANHSMFTP